MSEYARIKVSGSLEGDYVVLEHRSGSALRIAPVPPDGLPVVTALKKTCTACPAQWEGTLDDGRALYIRYRWGGLSVGAGKDIDDAVKNRWGDKALFEENVGDGLDGYMDFEELKAHLHGLLEFGPGLEAEVEHEPEFDPEAFKKLFAPKKGADTDPAEGGDEDEGTEERVGTGLTETEIRAWTCFSCGRPLTQAHEGDYFHTDEGSECTNTIPVPMSLVQGLPQTMETKQHREGD
jgi:hypothetical protein